MRYGLSLACYIMPERQGECMRGRRHVRHGMASGCTPGVALSAVVLVVCLCGSLWFASPGRAESNEIPEPPRRFRLWHDLGDVFSMAWRGAGEALQPSTLTYAVPAAAIIGVASFADDQVKAVFQGNDEEDALAHAGTTYALAYFGPVQAGLYVAGELLGDTKLSATGKKTMASLLGTTAVIQPLKFLTQRRRPDGSDRRSFPSFDTGAVSSIIPSLYADYGVVPAAVAAASAAFIGVSRIYGNKHHLSDVLTSYAIGIGWGILVEMAQRRRPNWALLPMSDGHAMLGLALHLRL
jgi:membrane-associated phospholipid phosphatase